jgi:hypothetical protein
VVPQQRLGGHLLRNRGGQHFHDGSRNLRAPKKLTNWDEAFLKGLYRGSDPLVRKRAEIVKIMRDELAP